MSAFPVHKRAGKTVPDLPLPAKLRELILLQSGLDCARQSDLPIELDLSRCQAVVDVSALGTVKVLNLSECSCVTDVSALDTVRELRLSRCVGVKDVSGLGDVEVLDLSCCYNVTDVSAPGYCQGAQSLPM